MLRYLLTFIISLCVLVGCNGTTFTNGNIRKIDKIESSIKKAYNKQNIQSDNISKIGGFTIGMKQDDLVKYLLKNEVSDAIYQSHPVKSRIGINGQDYYTYNEYYFDEDESLRLVSMSIYNTNISSILSVLRSALGEEIIIVKPSNSNLMFKHIWMDGNLVYSLENRWDAECYYLYVGDGSYQNEVATTTMSLTSSLATSLDICSRDSVCITYTIRDDEEFNISYDGEHYHSFYNIGVHNDSFYYTIEEAERKYSNDRNRTIKDCSLPLFELGLISPDKYKSSTKSQDEYYRSVNREKVMRDAGWEKMADKERKERQDKIKTGEYKF